MARVLISEPEPDLQLLAQELVRELGHEAVLVGRPEATRGDVLLVAVSAGLSELVAAVRQGQPALPVICSGTRPPSSEVRAIGAVAHLIKPFGLKELDRALSRALASTEAR